MKVTLPCDADPIALGIEKENGTWDETKFYDHIVACEKCSEKIKDLLDHLESLFKDGGNNAG